MGPFRYFFSWNFSLQVMHQLIVFGVLLLPDGDAKPVIANNFKFFIHSVFSGFYNALAPACNLPEVEAMRFSKYGVSNLQPVITGTNYFVPDKNPIQNKNSDRYKNTYDGEVIPCVTILYNSHNI